MAREEEISAVFVDSSIYFALNNLADPHFRKAHFLAKKLQEKSVRLFTATHILLEVTTLLSQRIGHEIAVKFLDDIRDGETTILHPSEYLILEGESLFKKQKSKNVSYADCMSFAIMRERNIKVAFSFDQDFKKNGYQLLQDLIVG